MGFGNDRVHIHFLIPCYGGQISEVTFTSFVRFIARAPQLGLEWSLDTLVNESLIPRGRNALVARAMHNPRATHLMFLDADIGFDPDYILMLLQEDVDVIGGGYPKKSLPIDYVINPIKDGEADDGKAEVERIGTGFLLLKREVFSRMAEAMPDLKYTDDCGLDPSINEHLYAFFECGLFGEKVFMSEDWLFCNRWRELGGRIFISKRFALTHVGSYAFSEASQADLLARLSAQLTAAPAATATTSPLSAPSASTSTSSASEPDGAVAASSAQPVRKSSTAKPAAVKTAAAKMAKAKPAAKTAKAKPAAKPSRSPRRKGADSSPAN
ncbi:glycosyltransferase family 2 protein [Synechococcus sp. MIT S9451]|uniref:glycosyltransferase family 2 protein n=1 Tax=Synechococcus sp. MIT S9451 TaxID=3082543 RepID=UPI0039B3D4DF